MSRDAGIYNNPSAGKFDPPPPVAAPSASGARPGRFVGAVLVLALVAARWRWPSHKGWAGLLLIVLSLIVHIVQGVVSKTEADEKGPYSERDSLTH
jgi:hypothetical protein